ncbi:nose resistant to fluoxetine protein 6-like [Penaeus chinensis]|uniref:nose resistant to fluoxetine protein 6-like n=1 Tax=Penaeus chinensis TaxID=139456 RepID=UPI001FB816DA|nr:nose resistant to fluoxetine protein 6-like [Penaeus chinensis]
MKTVGLCVIVLGCCIVAVAECRTSSYSAVSSKPTNHDRRYVESYLDARVRDLVANLSVYSTILSVKSVNPSTPELASSPSAWSYYLPVLVNATSPCGVALQAMLLSLADNSSSWAAQMMDSWGKFPDGFFFVGLRAVGVFEECINAQSKEKGLRGKYCNIAYSSGSGHGKENGVPLHDMTPRLGVVSGTLTPVTIGEARYDTCIPDACSQQDLQMSLEQILNSTGRELDTVFCQVKNKQRNYSPGAIAMISTLAVLLGILTAGTFLDLWYKVKKRPPSGFAPYLISFSVYTNFTKIFQISTEPTAGTITCLYGIRVLSMTWVILGHQYVYTLTSTANLLGAAKKVQGILFQVIANGNLCVDSFFFISGLLVANGVLSEVKRTGKFNVILYVLHRLLRLMPAIALVCLFMASLLEYIVTGPYAYDVIPSIQSSCSKFWWRDAFFVSNFFTPLVPGPRYQCMDQCWYTCVDSQMYLVAPLLVLPLHFSPRAGKVWLYFMSITSIAIPGVIIYVYDLPPGDFLLGNNDIVEYYARVYVAPWCRASPYIVGIWMGYFIYKQGSEKLSLKKWQLVAGWTCAVFASLGVLFGGWSYNKPFTAMKYDPVTQVLYGSLHRAVWAAALAWVVFTCHYGYGGLVNDFLSYPLWQPLSRITYAMYLTAICVQLVVAASARTPFYFSHVNKIIETCSTVFFTILVAVPLSLSVEAPVLRLEALLLRRPGRPKQNPTKVKLVGQDNEAFAPEVKELQVALQDEGEEIKEATEAVTRF